MIPLHPTHLTVVTTLHQTVVHGIALHQTHGWNKPLHPGFLTVVKTWFGKTF